MMEAKPQGRVLAWLALFVALVTSVAANVAFAQPHAGPRLSSSVAPILVILAAGLLERVPLAGVQWWRRLLAYLGLGVVIGAAFVTSFEHQFALLVRYGNSRLSSALLPIAVDGLIVLASVCLTVIAERRAVQSSAPRVPEPPAAQIPGLLSCVSPEGSPTAQPALTFAPEPTAQSTDDAAQEPAPRPLRTRSVARPRALRSAKSPAKPAAVDWDAVRSEYASGVELAKIRARYNGNAPAKRTFEVRTQDLREIHAQARTVAQAALTEAVGNDG